MPRPPVLPMIDWMALFAEAKDYSAWLAGAEFPDKRDKMEELRKGLKLSPAETAWLGALPRPVHVVAIAEDWCGDVVRQVPVLQKLAEAAPQLKVRYIAREPRGDVFARYLTNGGEAIPKFIFLTANFIECGNWGPMPAAERELIARGKAAGGTGPAREKIKLRYEADPQCRDTIRELLALIDIAAV